MTHKGLRRSREAQSIEAKVHLVVVATKARVLVKAALTEKKQFPLRGIQKAPDLMKIGFEATMLFARKRYALGFIARRKISPKAVSALCA